jgi:hypothetical protein
VAFADYDAYLAALNLQNFATAETTAVNTANAAQRMYNLSRVLAPTPTVPTASVAYTKSSDLAINAFVPDAGAGRLSILGGAVSTSLAAATGVMVVDILNMSGGLDGTSTAAQTTNLPTAALTRYTNGVGVHAALVMHTAVGATATTVTCSYTNSDGTSGRTTTASIFGGSTYNAVGMMLRLPLQAGDIGMRSIESVTLAASTGTIGNFGVVMYKPLAMLLGLNGEAVTEMDCVSTGRMVGQFNEVLDNACLSVFSMNTASQFVNATVQLGEA